MNEIEISESVKNIINKLHSFSKDNRLLFLNKDQEFLRLNERERKLIYFIKQVFDWVDLRIDSDVTVPNTFFKKFHRGLENSNNKLDELTVSLKNVCNLIKKKNLNFDEYCLMRFNMYIEHIKLTLNYFCDVKTGESRCNLYFFDTEINKDWFIGLNKDYSLNLIKNTIYDISKKRKIGNIRNINILYLDLSVTDSLIQVIKKKIADFLGSQINNINDDYAIIILYSEKFTLSLFSNVLHWIQKYLIEGSYMKLNYLVLLYNSYSNYKITNLIEDYKSTVIENTPKKVQIDDDLFFNDYRLCFVNLPIPFNLTNTFDRTILDKITNIIIRPQDFEAISKNTGLMITDDKNCVTAYFRLYLNDYISFIYQNQQQSLDIFFDLSLVQLQDILCILNYNPYDINTLNKNPAGYIPVFEIDQPIKKDFLIMNDNTQQIIDNDKVAIQCLTDHNMIFYSKKQYCVTNFLCSVHEFKSSKKKLIFYVDENDTDEKMLLQVMKIAGNGLLIYCKDIDLVLKKIEKIKDDLE